MESRLQSTVKKYLKSKGCVVLVISPSPGIPTGFPDILFMNEGFYGVIELKKKSPYKKDGTPLAGAFEPLQEHYIEKLHDWSWGRVVWPENWDEVKMELDCLL